MDSKRWLFCLIALITSSAPAVADSVIQVASKGFDCKIYGFVSGKWVPFNQSELEGKAVTKVTALPSDPSRVNFKIQDFWYVSQRDCLKSVPTNAPLAKPNQKIFLEAGVQKYGMLSKNPSSIASIPLVTSGSASTYQTNLGFGGRLGVLLNDAGYLIIDVSNVSGNQTLNYSGTIIGSPTASETLLSVNVGYQVPLLRKPILGIKTYLSAFLGYSKLSGALSGTVTDGGSGVLGVLYSGSSISYSLELMMLKEITAHWSAVIIGNGTYLKLTPTITDSNYSPLYAPGSNLPSANYSRITVTLGARFAFGV